MTEEAKTAPPTIEIKIDSLRQRLAGENPIESQSNINYFLGALEAYLSARPLKTQLEQRSEIESPDLLGAPTLEKQLTDLVEKIVEKGFDFLVLDEEFSSYSNEELLKIIKTLSN